MKKLFATIGAVALLAGATACVEQLDGNPNYNAKTKEVNAEFVMNVSTLNSTATKQSGAAVQSSAATGFRGISDAHLMTIAQKNGDNYVNNRIMSKDMNMDKDLSFSRAMTSVSSSVSHVRRVFQTSLPLQTNTVLFYGRAIREINESPSPYPASPALTDKDILGSLEKYDITSTAGSAKFSLAKRLGEDKETKFAATEAVLSGILTTILATGLFIDTETGNEQTNPTEYDSHGNINEDGFSLSGAKTSISEGGYPEFRWVAYTNTGSSKDKSPYDPSKPLSELELKLAKVYTQMTTIRTSDGELRAGSGEAILRMVGDLWTIVNEVQCATATNAQDAVAKYFAKIVNDRLLNYFSASVPNNGGIVESVAFKAYNNILTQLQKDVVPTHHRWPNDRSVSTNTWTANLTATEDFENFPHNFSLPRGATHMAFSSEGNNINEFYYPQAFNTDDFGGDPTTTGQTPYGPDSYFYPAELLYFGNSPIRTSSITFVDDNNSADNYPLAKDWNDAASWTRWLDAEQHEKNYVESDTRSVAMKYEVNYGVAMLETKVKYKDGLSFLYDNNHQIQVDLYGSSVVGQNDEPDKQIEITADSFKLTGIIIGGQSKSVGWDYLPIEDVSGFIYDRAIPTASQSIPGPTGTGSSISYTYAASQPVYTLVFDNFAGTLATSGSGAGYYTKKNTQDKVHVALEFRNDTGKDFYGNYNLIRAGGYFYLIGSLDVSNAKTIAQGDQIEGMSYTDHMGWPTNYVIPPYNAEGGSQKVERIFVQDYKTVATFVFHEKSLQAAYLTVPDLRSSSLTLGLSVNIDWNTGLTFEDVVLGGGSGTGN